MSRFPSFLASALLLPGLSGGSLPDRSDPAESRAIALLELAGARVGIGDSGGDFPFFNVYFHGVVVGEGSIKALKDLRGPSAFA